MAMTTVVFLAWDETFTRAGIWGFNERYLTGVYIGTLPIEEVLFFICIPYACVFTYFALNHLVKRDLLSKYHKTISVILIAVLVLTGIINFQRLYTLVTCVMLTLLLTHIICQPGPSYMGRFYLAFAVLLVPFLMVNGVLTGSFIEEEMVWYNNAHNTGVRIGTIPVEDIFYAMLLILTNISLYEWLRKKSAVAAAGRDGLRDRE